MNVYYSILLERSIPDIAVNALFDVVAHASQHGAYRINTPYARTDHKRQTICDAFLKASSDPNDVLVMLDNDHVHPRDIVGRLVRFPQEYGVVAALAYMRGKPHNPIFFVRKDRQLVYLPEFERKGLMPCAIAAPCAVAIRRWVLQKLIDKGEHFFWQYVYDDRWYGEDMYFGEICEKHGISHFVDLETLVPHLNHKLIGPEEWEQERIENNDPAEV